MPLRFKTARYAFPGGPDRVDVTLVGNDRLRKGGLPTPGEAFAPPASLLWPALRHLELADMLDARAATMPEESPHRAWLAAEADSLTRAVEAAYARLYREAMIDTYRRRRADWDALLQREFAVLCCFCRHRQPGPGQRHTCHRHLLSAMLVKLGAIDEGEVPLDFATDSRAAKPVPPAWIWSGAGARPKPGATADERALFLRMAADARAAVRRLRPGTLVVTGGAEGIDTAIEEEAAEAGLQTWTIAPWYSAFGKVDAPKIRNAYNAAGDSGGIWIGPWSRGSWDAHRKAVAGGIALYDGRHLWDPSVPAPAPMSPRAPWQPAPQASVAHAAPRPEPLTLPGMPAAPRARR